MELDKYDTVRDIQELLTISRDLERLERSGAVGDALQPRLDLLDTGDAYRLVLEVPGVPQENLEVALQGRALTVAGLREPAGEGERLVSERPSGPFQRSLELPGDVREDEVQARLYDGLLVLHLPKA